MTSVYIYSEFDAERPENRLSYRGEFSPFLIIIKALAPVVQKLGLVLSKQVAVELTIELEKEETCRVKKK